MTDPPATDPFAAIVDRFVLASVEFERTIRDIAPGQWEAATPCPAWTVRDLVNHMTRGNLSYARLLAGGTRAEFLRLRDTDALGDDPPGAFRRSARTCAEAFRQPGALARVLDYPLGLVHGRQALAVRTADSTIHTWDLACAIGADDRLEPSLVSWICAHLADIYEGLAESPVSATSTHRFFAAPGGPLPPGATAQDQLLQLTGRKPLAARTGEGSSSGRR
jgi:uncharacterized protein (TIGR03086 family)